MNDRVAYENKPVTDLKYVFSYDDSTDTLVWNNGSFKRMKLKLREEDNL